MPEISKPSSGSNPSNSSKPSNNSKLNSHGSTNNSNIKILTGSSIKFGGSARYLCAFFILLAFWQLFSVSLSLPVVPSPAAVFRCIIEIFASKLAVHSLYSLGRIFIGVFLSLAVGIPIGLFMGYFNRLDKFLSPMTYFAYPIPKIALLPVIMLIFGLGESSKIIMIVLIVFFQVVVAARDAVKSIPQETYYSLRSLGAGKIEMFRHIILPASLPGLLTSLRVGLGTVLSVLFFTETFGTRFGLGYFIMDSWMRINYLEMYSGIVALSITGFLLFLGIDMLERALTGWR